MKVEEWNEGKNLLITDHARNKMSRTVFLILSFSNHHSMLSQQFISFISF